MVEVVIISPLGEKQWSIIQAATGRDADMACYLGMEALAGGREQGPSVDTMSCYPKGRLKGTHVTHVPQKVCHCQRSASEICQHLLGQISGKITGISEHRSEA